jgi:hypothetical protein
MREARGIFMKILYVVSGFLELYKILLEYFQGTVSIGEMLSNNKVGNISI